MEFGNLKSVFNLHTSPEASYSVDRHRQAGERIPNTPRDILSTYLGDLATSHSLFNHTLADYETRRDAQIRARITAEDMIPISQIERVRNAAAGEMLTNEDIVANIQFDQACSLQSWIDYLSDPELIYPAWFKYYAYRSVFQLSKYDLARKKFSTRTKHTVTAFPELNQEALAMVYGHLQDNPDEQRGFASLYAEELDKATSAEFQDDSIEGVWVRYPQSEDIEAARILSSSLSGKNTTWCTAQQGTAYQQLRRGDFHVYYTYDHENRPTIPRLAVRMSGNDIGEVRGIAQGQAIEAKLYDVLADKLTDFKDNAQYVGRLKNASLLDTRLREALEKNPNAELSLDQLKELYSLDVGVEDDSSRRYLALTARMVLEGETRGSKTRAELRKSRTRTREDAERLLPDATLLERAVRLHSDYHIQALLSSNVAEYANDERLVISMREYGAVHTAHIVGRYIRYFSSLSNVAASLLVENNMSDILVRFADRFVDLDTHHVNVFEAHNSLDLVFNKNATMFKGSANEVVQMLFATHPHTTANAIARTIDHLPALSFDIAQKLVNAGHGKFVHAHLDHFPEIDTRVGKGRAQVSRLRKSKQPVKLIRLALEDTLSADE